MMKTDEPTVERSKLHVWAKAAVEFVGLGSVAIFIFSALFNTYVFAAWEVSYLQVATAPDVFIGAMQFAMIAFPIPLSFAAGYYLSPRLGWGVMILIVGGSAVLMCSLVLFPAPPGGAYPVPFRILEFAAPMVVVAIFGVEFRARKDSPSEKVGRIETWLALAGIAALGLFIFPISALARDGFMNQASFVQIDDLRCQILWRGSENAVVRCPDSRMAVVPSEGLVIEIGAAPFLVRK